MAAPTPISFGALLRRFRRAAGMSQEALAERASLSRRAISDLERDSHRVPRKDTVELLAKALELVGQELAQPGGRGSTTGAGSTGMLARKNYVHDHVDYTWCHGPESGTL